MSAQARDGDSWPRFRPVAEEGLLVEFGASVDAATHDRVVQLDLHLAARPPAGLLEAVPAFCSLLVRFDPGVTDHAAVRQAVERLLAGPPLPVPAPSERTVEVCYDGDLATDLAAVVSATGLSAEAVIAQHLSGSYSVAMYGFAPGYAYLAGTPEPIQRPRKPVATRGVPQGSVLIAGPQCLVSTLTMPSGWWIVGRSPTSILSSGADRPFLFDVGDRVAFRRIDRAAFDARRRQR